MKIYTKTGDAGETGLFSGRRVPKSHPLVTAYGTVDELNSQLGVVLASEPSSRVSKLLKDLQIFLFKLGADLATESNTKMIDRVSATDVAAIEKEIDEIASQLPVPGAFILPGGTRAAAHLHVARTVCRRAERDAISAGNINSHALVWLNRLSDLLFLLARWDNQDSGVAEPLWHSEDARSSDP